MLNEEKSASGGVDEELNQTESVETADGKVKHSLLTPLLIVLLVLMLLGAIGLGVYYYWIGIRGSQTTATTTNTPVKSPEETQLDSVQTDLDNTKDFDTTGIDEDAAEINSIDVSGAL